MEAWKRNSSKRKHSKNGFHCGDLWCPMWWWHGIFPFLSYFRSPKLLQLASATVCISVRVKRLNQSVWCRLMSQSTRLGANRPISNDARRFGWNWKKWLHCDLSQPLGRCRVLPASIPEARDGCRPVAPVQVLHKLYLWHRSLKIISQEATVNFAPH